VHQNFNAYQYLFQLLQLVIHRWLLHALWPASGIHPDQRALWSSAFPTACIYIQVWGAAMRAAINQAQWASCVGLLGTS